MHTYNFHDGPLPAGVTLGYSPSIFNTDAYRLLHPAENEQSFFLLEKNQLIAYAGVHFHIDGGVARSPFRAPFGSFEFNDQLAPRKLYEFLQHVETRLRSMGVKQVFLKNPPQAYASARSALLQTFLLNQQYRVYDAEVSVGIPVTSKTFSECIRHSEQLRLRQGTEAGFVFHHPAVDKIGEVYRFLAVCHKEKKYTLSISEEELMRAVTTFPDKYILSVIKYQERLVAAAVSIRISESVLYNFLVNHLKEFNTLSPPVMLVDGLYTYCQEQSIALLDLGTSALAGQPNFSLLDFKLHLGGVPSAKFTFFKEAN